MNKNRYTTTHAATTLTYAASILSKLLSLAFQLIAIPVGIKSLGVNTFAQYATVMAISVWPILFIVGVGPGLTAKLATDKNPRARYRRILTLLTANGAMVALASNATIWGFYLAGSKSSTGFYSIFREQIFALLVISNFSIASVLFNAPEAIQIATRKAYRLSISSGVATVASMTLILMSQGSGRTIIWYWACLHAPLFLMRLFNNFHFIMSSPYLRQACPELVELIRRKRRIRLLDDAKHAAAFSLASGLFAYIANQFPAILFSDPNDGSAVAFLALSISIVSMLTQPVSIVLTPLVPILASRRQNTPSVYRTDLTYTFFFCYGYAVALAVSLALFARALDLTIIGSGLITQNGAFVIAYFSLASVCEFSLFHVSHSSIKVRQVYILYALRIAITFTAGFFASLFGSAPLYLFISASSAMVLFVIPQTVFMFSDLKNGA